MLWYRSRAPLCALAIVVIGGLLGVSADRLPIGAMARSIVAMVVAWLAGLLLASFILAFQSPDASETGRIPAGLMEVSITIVAAAVVAALLHLLVSWDRTGLSQEVLRHRTVGMAMAGFAAGTLQAAVRRGFEYRDATW